MDNNREIAIKMTGVKKRYRLGQIGGGTLQADLQSWWAKVRGKEDPNTKIGQEQRLVGQSFMALNGIDLTIYKGEAVGIIGTNGAGKSTLLKILSRVTAPTAGEIDIYGRIASMLEVGTGFSPEMTGRENVYMNGAILGMTKAEIDAKMEEIIEFSEVRDFIDTPVKRYSSGMYVKLAFSVAAHLDSEIMIMDEVLAVGDMAFQKKCLTKMKEAATKEGRTVLYVSHNMNTIRQLCERCIVLDKGKVVFMGDVEEAIGVYMNADASEIGVKLDLSDKRMSHLSNSWKCKMTQIELKEKEVPLYEMNEKINVDLEVLSKTNMKNVCLRFEIRTMDDSPICTGIKQNLFDVFEGEKSVISFGVTPVGLIPGRYKALIVLYLVNEYGSYEDLDAIYPTFVFEITDTKKHLDVNWNDYHWGKIKIEELVFDKITRLKVEKNDS